MKSSKAWVKSNDYYNREIVTWDVYSKKFGRGTVYVQDCENFMYTCSFGSSSDYSYSGSFFSCDTIKTISDAMSALDIIVPLHLTDEFKKLKAFRDTL